MDRLLLHTASILLNSQTDDMLCDSSFAFRKGKGVKKAIEQAAHYIETDNKYVVIIDIKNYFDEINHEILHRQLQQIYSDEKIISFIIKSISVTAEYDYIDHDIQKGIMQGNPLSPLLSNIYLNELDKKNSDKI